MESEQKEEVQERLSDEQKQYLAHAFEHHPPSDKRIASMHRSVRSLIREGAAAITFLPPTPERAVSLQKLEEAMMWANACIARHQEAILKNLDGQQAE